MPRLWPPYGVSGSLEGPPSSVGATQGGAMFCSYKSVRTALARSAAALLFVGAVTVTPPGFAASDIWSEPVPVVADPDLSASIDAQSAAVTSRGRELALLVNGGPRLQLQVASRRAGERDWAAPVALSGRARWLENPQLLVWGDGRATAVWTTGVQPRIFTASMAANGRWGPQRRVDIPALPAVFSLRAARSDDGTIAIAWNQGEGRGAAAAVHRPGGPWRMTGVHRLAESTPTGVVIDRSGTVHVAVFQQTADTRVPAERGGDDIRGVYLLDIRRNGTWGPAHRVGPPPGSSHDLQDYGTYRFSRNDDGDILLAWGEYNDRGNLIFVLRVRHAGSGFGPRQPLPRQPQGFRGGTGIPLAQLTASGAVVIVYGARSPEGTGYPTFIRRRTSAGTWLAPRRVTPDPDAYYTPARLAVGPGGAALLTVTDSSDRVTSVVRCLRSAPCGNGSTFVGMDVGSLLAFGPSGRGLIITGDHSDPVSRRLPRPVG
jgi:hypothetical protein